MRVTMKYTATVSANRRILTFSVVVGVTAMLSSVGLSG